MKCPTCGRRQTADSPACPRCGTDLAALLALADQVQAAAGDAAAALRRGRWAAARRGAEGALAVEPALAEAAQAAAVAALWQRDFRAALRLHARACASKG